MYDHKDQLRHNQVTRRELITQFVSQMQFDNATIFFGAGMSQACGLPSWGELLRPIFEEFNIDPAKSEAFYKYDYYDLAEKYVQYKTARTSLNNILQDKLSERRQPSDNHKLITRLPLTRIWTTNYDTIIEDAYSKSGKQLSVIRNDYDFTIATKEHVKLYKTHGCTSDITNVVITKSDLHAYEKNYEIMSKAFSTALAEDTFLFLGFSFDDLHFDSVMGMLKRRLGNNAKQHYAVIKRPRTDKANEEKSRNEHFAFDLLCRTLASAGIKTLHIDDYVEIPMLLKDIEKVWLRSNVFISGSFDKDFHDKHVKENIEFKYYGKSCLVPYDDRSPVHSENDIMDTYYLQEIVKNVKQEMKKQFPFTNPKRMESILKEIGKELIKRNMNIYTGYGLGVCDHVLEGASKQLESEENFRNLTDRLKIFPLPLRRHVEDFQRNVFYREALLGSCGVMIITRGSTFSSDYTSGTYEEYYIAKGLSNLLFGKQKSIFNKLSKIDGFFKEQKKADTTDVKCKDILISCYEDQINIVRYQFLEVIEMFYRILHEQWKLVIRSIDAYRERMTILVEKVFCNHGVYMVSYEKGAYKSMGNEPEELSALKNSWLDINYRLRRFVKARTVKFYCLFEIAGGSNVIMEENDRVDDDYINDMIDGINEFKSKIEKYREGQQGAYAKAVMICSSLIKLVQADWKYYKVNLWKNELDEAESNKKEEDTWTYSDETSKDHTGRDQLEKYMQRFNLICRGIRDIRRQTDTAEGKQAAKKEQGNNEETAKERVFNKQVHYLLSDRTMACLEGNGDQDFAQAIINKYFEEEKAHLNELKGVDSKPAEEEASKDISDKERKKRQRFQKEENQRKMDILKIQAYKIFLVISDVIGGFQRIKGDYETMQIEPESNNNDHVRDSSAAVFCQDAGAPKEKGKDETPVASPGSSIYDPFFYNPNKINRYIELQKRYIDYYRYHVNFMKEMVRMKSCIKEISGIYLKKKGNEERNDDRIVMSNFISMNKVMREMDYRTKKIDDSKDLYGSKPFRSGTVILPLAAFGGMAQKIWKEERVRFDYLCSNMHNFEPETREKLLAAYDDLYNIKFDKKGLRVDEMIKSKERLMESLFVIIDEFRKAPRTGLENDAG